MLFVALAAAIAWRAPPTRFEVAQVNDTPQQTQTVRDASPRTAGSAVTDLSLPTASEVRFAPADVEDDPATF